MRELILLVLCVAGMHAQCSVSIVGGGVGGLHTAFRLINSSKYQAQHVCVFEASNRVGGRAFSVHGATPIADTIDIGAHGYKPLHHKIMDSIVNVVLGLHTSCRSRNQTKTTCYDLGDSYYYLRGKYLNKLKTNTGALPYNVRKDEKSNDADGPDLILEAVLMYPPIVNRLADLFSFDPSIRYPAIKDVLAAVREYKINGKYPTQYTLETLLNHSSEYHALYLDADGEAISSVLNVNVYDVLREAVYYATPDDTPTDGGFVITNEQDIEIGYDSVSKGLAALLVNLGASVQYNKKLVSLTTNVNGTQTLKFADSSSVVSEKVILNIALEQLNQLSRDSSVFTDSSRRLFSLVNEVCAIKAYFYYPTAWWRPYGDASISTTDINRYFEFKDSNIRCSGTTCSGVVQVVYADGLDYCTTFWPGSDDVLTIINSSDTDPIRSTLFAKLSASTKAVQQLALRSSVAIVDPTVLVLGRWSGAWHTILPSSQHLGGDVQTLLLNPVIGLNVYLVNEAYSVDQGWAEGSLIASEKVLAKYFNLTRPSWMGNDYWYNAIILNDRI